MRSSPLKRPTLMLVVSVKCVGASVNAYRYNISIALEELMNKAMGGLPENPSEQGIKERLQEWIDDVLARERVRGIDITYSGKMTNVLGYVNTEFGSLIFVFHRAGHGRNCGLSLSTHISTS